MRFNVYDNTKLIGGVSIAPQSFASDSAVDGSAVDTLGADNAAIHALGAAASGSPSAASLAVKLQESPDNNSDWTDALDNAGDVIGFTLNCESGAAENVARIEGLNLNRMRYLRAVVTPTLTGGTDPAILGFAEIILGNTGEKPVDATVSNT